MTDSNPAPPKLSRDDELRLFALQTATKDRFHFDKESAEPARERALADARAYYAFLTENDHTEGNPA